MLLQGQSSIWRYRLNWSSVCSHLPSSYPTITGITFCKEMIIWPNKYEQRKKSVKKCSAGCEIISYFYLFNKLLKIHLIIKVFYECSLVEDEQQYWQNKHTHIDKINKYQIFFKVKIKSRESIMVKTESNIFKWFYSLQCGL